MPAPRTLAWLACLAVLAVLLLAAGLRLRPPGGRDEPLSPTPPAEPDFAETGEVDKDRPLFNDFSWREFIALNWPAREGRRGEPDPDKKFGDRAGDVVWGSWKSLDELFPPDPEVNRPTCWDSFDAVRAVPRLDKSGKLFPHRLDEVPFAGGGRRKILAPAHSLGSLNEPGFGGTPHGPLIAQNGTYVRYETRVNQTAYEFITRNQYYLREKLPRLAARKLVPVPFEQGSVLVRAAWMELPAEEGRERFYHVDAEVVEWGEDGRPRPRPAVVGLVGLHVLRKTALRPSWIWSTFEHVDNTEPGPGAARASFSRDGPATRYPAGFDYQPDPVAEGKPLPAGRRPVEVQRLMDLRPTGAVNARYRQREGVRGTVWENYRLVATQWVARPDSGDPDDGGLRRLPPPPVSNTTMETYLQDQSCLTCHAAAPDFRHVFFPSFRAR
jgi:hypothetical protein